MHLIRHRCPGAAAPYALKPFTLTRYRQSTEPPPQPQIRPSAHATKVPQIAKTVPLTKVRQADTEPDIPWAESCPVTVPGPGARAADLRGLAPVLAGPARTAMAAFVVRKAADSACSGRETGGVARPSAKAVFPTGQFPAAEPRVAVRLPGQEAQSGLAPGVRKGFPTIFECAQKGILRQRKPTTLPT